MKQLKLMMACLIISAAAFAAETEGTAATAKETTQGPASGAIAQNHENAIDSSIEKIGHDAFMKAPGLTDAQRKQLGEVMKTTMSEAGKIKMEIAAQKVDFFTALTEEKQDAGKIKKIKKTILALDSKRLALMFKSLDDVQKIIGKNPEAGKYLRNIMREHVPPSQAHEL